MKQSSWSRYNPRFTSASDPNEDGLLQEIQNIIPPPPYHIELAHINESHFDRIQPPSCYTLPLLSGHETTKNQNEPSDTNRVSLSSFPPQPACLLRYLWLYFIAIVYNIVYSVSCVYIDIRLILSFLWQWTCTRTCDHARTYPMPTPKGSRLYAIGGLDWARRRDVV